MSRQVSIKDIARAAGVSYSTVSRALNDSSLISDDVRRRVRSLAQEMGYTPNGLAQSLHSRRTNSIGVIITTIGDPFFVDVVQGVDDVARQTGNSVFLATSNNDPDEEIRIIETFDRRRVDGVIVAASRVGDEYANRLEQIHIPVILVNNQAVGAYRNLYSVAVDDYNGACQAVQHLLELGHRRIGYIGINNRPGSNELRLRGYLDTLQAAGITPAGEWIQINAGHTLEGLRGDMQVGYTLGGHILGQELTAVFCYCDSIAAGLLRACRERGLRVPEDLSVVGYDDSEICEVVHPPLTTVHQPRRPMGRLATEMLLASIAGEQLSDQKLQLDLVVRGSTAPLTQVTAP